MLIPNYKNKNKICTNVMKANKFGLNAYIHVIYVCIHSICFNNIKYVCFTTNLYVRYIVIVHLYVFLLLCHRRPSQPAELLSHSHPCHLSSPKPTWVVCVYVNNMYVCIPCTALPASGFRLSLGLSHFVLSTYPLLQLCSVDTNHISLWVL